jgi:hypothetical protein
MKNLWCYNFLIFYPILINDTSNKIRFRNTIARHAIIFFDIIFFDRPQLTLFFLSCTVYFFIFILIDVYLLKHKH